MSLQGVKKAQGEGHWVKCKFQLYWKKYSNLSGDSNL